MTKLKGPIRGEIKLGNAEKILRRSDIPTKEYILSLNNQKEPSERFVLEDLDDKHLFVQPTVTSWLETQLKEFQDSITYQPPRRED